MKDFIIRCIQLAIFMVLFILIVSLIMQIVGEATIPYCVASSCIICSIIGILF